MVEMVKRELRIKLMACLRLASRLGLVCLGKARGLYGDISNIGLVGPGSTTGYVIYCYCLTVLG